MTLTDRGRDRLDTALLLFSITVPILWTLPAFGSMVLLLVLGAYALHRWDPGTPVGPTTSTNDDGWPL